MSGWQLLRTGWDWEPSIVVGCGALLLGYFALLKFKWSPRVYYFFTGVAILFLALVSPLDLLADKYLFSAHMLQHILLILFVPPLLILGIPVAVARKVIRLRPIAIVEHWLSIPSVAWTLGVATMWLWHWPPLYNAALNHEPLHIAQHLIFLITATIFWWPVITPIRGLQLSPLSSVVYVFSACVAHSLLAILITFAPLGIYPAYLQPVDTLHLLPLIRNRWGLTPGADQQWGGLLMWVPACLVYLLFLMATLAQWYGVPEPSISTRPAGANHGG